MVGSDADLMMGDLHRGSSALSTTGATFFVGTTIDMDGTTGTDQTKKGHGTKFKDGIIGQDATREVFSGEEKDCNFSLRGCL